MQNKNKASLVSLIIPAYNEEDILVTFLATIDQCLDDIDMDKELIVVDDGSVDGSWELLCSLVPQYSNLKLIRFSRNFGKEAAIMAGINQCAGDVAIVLDADLQHPPQLLKSMLDLWLQEDIDIVDGVKVVDQRTAALDRLSSNFFNSVFSRATGYDMNGASDYKLLGRNVVDALKELQDYNLFFRGATLWLGFKHKKIQYQVEQRPGGRGKWSLMSRFRLAITAITSFTSLPLHLMTLVGILSFLFALLLGAQTLYMKFNGSSVEGFTTVIILVLFFGSMITLGLGIIGAYLSKIHDEVRGRPRYFIEETVNTLSPDDA